MTEAWYKGLPESEEDRLYEESVKRIKSAVEQDMPFEQAVGLIEVKDAELKALIIDDALKVLIAEMHFTGGIPLEELAKKFRLPLKKLEGAKKAMLSDIEAAAIEKWKEESGGHSGTA
jgi:hypothetical protein